MSEVNAANRDSDEVGLVDFLAVVVRWRTLVLALTGAALVLGVLLLFVLPAAGFYHIGGEDRYVVQVDYRAASLPAAIRDTVDADILARARSRFVSIGEVSAAWEADVHAGNQRLVDLDLSGKGALESYVKTKVLDKTWKAIFDEKASLLSVSMVDEDDARALAMIKDMESRVVGSIASEYKEMIRTSREVLRESQASLERQIAVGGNTGSATNREAAVAEIRQKLMLLDQLEANPAFPLAAVREPVVVKAEPKDYGDRGVGATTLFVVLVAGAILGSLVLAFLLEYVRRLRANQVEMAKLKAAWERRD